MTVPVPEQLTAAALRIVNDRRRRHSQEATEWALKTLRARVEPQILAQLERELAPRFTPRELSLGATPWH